MVYARYPIPQGIFQTHKPARCKVILRDYVHIVFKLFLWGVHRRSLPILGRVQTLVPVSLGLLASVTIRTYSVINFPRLNLTSLDLLLNILVGPLRKVVGVVIEKNFLIKLCFNTRPTPIRIRVTNTIDAPHKCLQFLWPNKHWLGITLALMIWILLV
jgi:hypothetical protein